MPLFWAGLLLSSLRGSVAQIRLSRGLVWYRHDCAGSETLPHDQLESLQPSLDPTRLPVHLARHEHHMAGKAVREERPITDLPRCGHSVLFDHQEPVWTGVAAGHRFHPKPAQAGGFGLAHPGLQHFVQWDSRRGRFKFPFRKVQAHRICWSIAPVSKCWAKASGLRANL